MRILLPLAALLLALGTAACSNVETTPTDTDRFAAGHYRYYAWRNQPLVNTTRSSDPIYLLDPIVRTEVDSALRLKGYILDPQRAQFNVTYRYAMGMRMGEMSQESTNITPYPTAVPNRRVDQAVVDNAIALGGMKETSNLALQFHDQSSNDQVWQVIITKIVENANQRVDPAKFGGNLRKALEQALRPLPDAAQ